mmetsp:Transcript_27387/g.36624  ORF Transcript_27387/g.36624 Transcript_27387/m.36624 type:complete len:81 (+) Transcript_27387:180-422(+)
MLRHGAVSHSEGLEDAKDFFGVPAGHLTKQGRVQAAKLGKLRFGEYHYLKEFIAYKYNQNAFLSLGQKTDRHTQMGDTLI